MLRREKKKFLPSLDSAVTEHCGVTDDGRKIAHTLRGTVSEFKEPRVQWRKT